MNADGKVDKENIGIVAPTDASTGKPEDGKLGYNYDIQDTWTQVALTFVFVSVILTLKDVRGRGTAPPSDNGVLVALAVILTLYGCIQAALAHTGPGFNPAVAAAQIALSFLNLDNTNGYLTRYAYCYLAGPLVGGAFAGIFHSAYSRLSHKGEESEQEKGSSINAR